MSENYHKIRWANFSLSDPESWVPVFGKWCGPGYSDGKRQKVFDPSSEKLEPAKRPKTDEDNPIDLRCMQHDVNYLNVQDLPDEWQRTLAYDIIIRDEIRQLDPSRLTEEERLYRFALLQLFDTKIALLRRFLEEKYTPDEETKKQLEKLTQALFEESAKKIDELVKVAEQASNKAFEFAFPEMKKGMKKKLVDFMKDSAQKKKNHLQTKQQTKAYELSSQKASESRKTGTSATILGDIMTPEKLFNDEGRFHKHTFASPQKRDFVQDSIDAVLHATHTHQYDPADFDFLFKNKRTVPEQEEQSTADKFSEESSSEDESVRAKSRNYV